VLFTGRQEKIREKRKKNKLSDAFISKSLSPVREHCAVKSEEKKILF
jgi:hypothetical protein